MEKSKLFSLPVSLRPIMAKIRAAMNLTRSKSTILLHYYFLFSIKLLKPHDSNVKLIMKSLVSVRIMLIQEKYNSTD